MNIDHLRVAAWWAEILDNKFSIGKFNFGLDPVINIIPIAGPIITFGLSLYLLWIARVIDAPADVRRKMLRNIVIDLALGSIPIVGTVGDFLFKANLRNLKLLEDWSGIKPIEGNIIAARKVA